MGTQTVPPPHIVEISDILSSYYHAQKIGYPPRPYRAWFRPETCHVHLAFDFFLELYRFWWTLFIDFSHWSRSGCSNVPILITFVWLSSCWKSAYLRSFAKLPAECRAHLRMTEHIKVGITDTRFKLHRTCKKQEYISYHNKQLLVVYF